MVQEPFTLTVVCPAFNEEKVLPLFHQRLTEVLAGLPDTCTTEVVYVDDGSRDRTLTVLRELAGQDPRVRYLSFSRNFGHQAALSAGLDAACGDAVITMDSDLQHPPALIPTLLRHWQEGNDVVHTIREEAEGPGWVGRLLSRGFYVCMGWLSNTEIRPAAADFRLLSRRAVAALLSLHETHRFLRGLVPWLGFPSAAVRYVPAARAAGEPKYTFRRRLQLALDGILSFSKAPLRLPLLAGLPAVAFGLLTCAYAALQWLSARDGTPALGTGLLGSVYLLGGSILCGLGILGEYVARIFDEVRARPCYLVKERGGRAAAFGHEGLRRSAALRRLEGGAGERPSAA
jgi:dolichol-phosphate mannosyltransferase